MRVVFTYDTEEPGLCIPALRVITRVHRRFDAPMTLFVVGELAAGAEGPALRRLLDETPDLHDVNSHTWSHSRLICKNPWSLPVPAPEFIHEETARGVAAIRDRFDRPGRGFRPRSGAGCGFRGCPENLFALRAAGCEWSSAYLKSAFEDSLPGDLHGPFSYADDGYDDLLELPGHGWQDALVKDYGRGLQYAVRWPSPFAYPRRLVETPQEEFAVHRRTLDAAEAAGLPFCCFVFHPWTMIRRQDPDGDCIDLLLRLARARGHEITTLDAEARRCRERPDLLSPAPPIPPQRTRGYDVARHFA